MNSIIVFLELIYVTLQSPQDLPVYLRKIPGRNLFSAITLGLVALAMATARYYLRQTYDSAFLGYLFLGWINVFILLGCAAILLGLLLHLLSGRENASLPTAISMIHIAIQAFLPLVFCVSVAIPARLFTRSELLMLPALLLFLCWGAYIVVKAMQYLYEISLRTALLAGLKALAILIVFPLSVAMAFLFQIIYLFL